MKAKIDRFGIIGWNGDCKKDCYDDAPYCDYDDVVKLVEPLEAEIDRLNALLKVDWKPIGEVELNQLQDLKRYKLKVKGLHGDNIASEIDAIWITGDNTFLFIHSFMIVKEWCTITHVAEFHYAEPPAVE